MFTLLKKLSFYQSDYIVFVISAVDSHPASLKPLEKLIRIAYPIIKFTEVIVAVTMLDIVTVNPQERFQEISNSISAMFKKINHSIQVKFAPVSGRCGYNIVQSHFPWEPKTLVNMLKEISIKTPTLDHLPLRFMIHKVFKIGSFHVYFRIISFYFSQEE